MEYQYENAPVEFDRLGRMKTHPFYHPRQGVRMTEEEKEYLCRFFKHDGLKSMSMALGRTEKSVSDAYHRLRAKRKVHFYKLQYEKRQAEY